jgi:hypothetical protein
MATANPAEEKKVTILLPEDQKVEGFLIHRGGNHSRVAIPKEKSQLFEGGMSVDESGTALIPNEMIQEIASGEIEPGQQKGGISAEDRAKNFLEGKT